jgi:hypothetical protein
MPAIQSQVLTATGLILTLSRSADLSGTQTLEIQATTVGNTTTVRILRNGAQSSSANINNATATQLENQINTFLSGQTRVTIRGTPVPIINCLVHVFTVNPLRLVMISANRNITPDSNWWAEE